MKIIKIVQPLNASSQHLIYLHRPITFSLRHLPFFARLRPVSNQIESQKSNQFPFVFFSHSAPSDASPHVSCMPARMRLRSRKPALLLEEIESSVPAHTFQLAAAPRPHVHTCLPFCISSRNVLRTAPSLLHLLSDCFVQRR
jgi:hypothetical protein